MTEKKKYTDRQERIARFAKALGHPARIAIMEFLAKQQTCYFGAIHEELPISKATVSQHLKELKDAGLIQGELETPKVKYCINQDNWLLAKSLFKDFLETEVKKRNAANNLSLENLTIVFSYILHILRTIVRDNQTGSTLLIKITSKNI